MKSRIATKLNFPDYNINELKEILDNELSMYKLELNHEANEEVIKNIEQAKQDDSFGNCRYVKNLAMEIVKKHVNADNKSKVVLAESIPMYQMKNKNLIGFRMEVVNG